MALHPQAAGTYLARGEKYYISNGNCAALVSTFGKITDAEIISRGKLAWDSSLSTINVGKFELGLASMGICSHAFYEAICHAADRTLYGRQVTDFPHVKKFFSEAYCRLVAVKMVGLRATDYLRTASDDDRRYLLYISSSR